MSSSTDLTTNTVGSSAGDKNTDKALQEPRKPIYTTDMLSLGEEPLATCCRTEKHVLLVTHGGDAAQTSETCRF